MQWVKAMNEAPKFKQLINPHSHSDYSLDGASTVKQIVKRNKDLGATHVCVTEHGNMNSAMELYMAAKEKGLKPILGIEAYLINPYHAEYVELYRKAHAAGIVHLTAKDPVKVENQLNQKAMNQYMHVTVHFKDEWAYKYFCMLTPKMYERGVTRNGEFKPMLTMEELQGAAGHITIMSSCFKGPVQISLLPSRDGVIPVSHEKSERMYNWLKDIAGKDNFFVEVFPHSVTHDWKRPEYDKDTRKLIHPGGFVQNQCTCEAPDGDLQKPLNRFVYGMAEKYGDKAVISLDSHFALPQQKVIQDAKLGNGSEQWQFHENYYIMESDTAAQKLKHTLGLDDKAIEKMIDNSYQWASNFDNFKLTTNKERWAMEDTSAEFMKRMPSTITKYGRMNYNDEIAVKRLQKEIKVLAYNGHLNMLSYFDIVEGIANFCRDNDILINVRGSAGGSFLLYLLGISAVNPLEYNLSLERFITEGRLKANTLPDADIDVANQEAVFRYLKDRYGDRMCRISTNMMLKLKSSINDAERAVLGSVRSETVSFVKMLPDNKAQVSDHEFVFGYTKDGVDHAGLLAENKRLQKYAEENPKIWEMVSEMMGVMRNKSVHACGVVIADRPVQEYCPVMIVNGERVTGFSPKSVEAAGLIKFDILGLNTLRDIQDAIKSIEQRFNVKLNPWKLPLDEECFEEFGKGHTETVFQFDSPTAKPLLIGIKPRTIMRISDTTALGRPGTLDAPSGDGRTLAEVFLACCQGETVRYIHPDVAHIMKDTMGIQLYQEQTMQLFKDLAGFTDEETEVVRRGIGKKEEKVLASSTGRLREQCLKRGWTNEQVDLLLNQIMASANYSFNRSHSVSYAVCAYACMFLKTKYKLDWWKATLSNCDKKELSTKFWPYVQDFVDLPDINKSGKDYSIVGDRLVSPLSTLSGVGPKAYEQLTKHIPYKSFEDFVKIHLGKREADDRSAVNRGIVEKLVAAGILDSLLPEGLDIANKLGILNETYAVIRKKEVEPINPKYVGITALGRYMVKKQLIPIYSQDLRNLMLQSRGGRIQGHLGRWQIAYDEILNDQGAVELRYIDVFDGNQIEFFRNLQIESRDKRIAEPDGVRHLACVAYVIDEKAFPYRNKTKQATRLYFDVNGYFFDEMLWPKNDENIAISGFKGLPVLLILRDTEKRQSIEKIIPLLKKDDLENYFVV